MAKYTIKRLLQSCVTLLIVVTIVFLLLRLLPTDYYFTEEQLIKLTDQQRHDQLQAAGLLDSPLTQLLRYLNGMAHFDLGTSRRIQNGVSVVEVIGGKFGVSMKLGAIAMTIALVLGVVMGVLQARYKNGIFDGVGTAYTIFVNAVPPLVSYSLVLIFGARVLGLPSMYSIKNVSLSSVLPVICLSMAGIASYALWIRRYMVDELTKDYIKLAQIKGMSTRNIMFKHVLKNAFVPMAQYLPYNFVIIIGGSLLVERFFSVPGLGPLMTDSILRYDTNIVQALTILYAALGILGVFLGDVLMVIIDPRIRLTGKGEVR